MIMVSQSHKNCSTTNRRRVEFNIEKVIFLNGGIYHRLHRPSIVQQILLMPVIGAMVARSMTLAMFEKALGKIFTGKFKLSKTKLLSCGRASPETVDRIFPTSFYTT